MTRPPRLLVPLTIALALGCAGTDERPRLPKFLRPDDPPQAKPAGRGRASDPAAGPSRDEFTPVGRSQAAAMTLDIRAPRAAQSGERFLAAVELTNPGATESAAATVTLTAPEGVELADFSFAPDAQSAGRYTWSFDRIPPSATRDVQFRVRAPNGERLTLSAEAIADDGAKASQTAGVDLGRAGLELRVDAPERRPAGEVVRVPVTVLNTGTRPAENVSVFATLPEGASPGGRPVERRYGTLPAGGRKTETFEFTPEREGRWRMALDASGDGNTAARGEGRGGATARRAPRPGPPPPPAPDSAPPAVEPPRRRASPPPAVTPPPRESRPVAAPVVLPPPPRVAGRPAIVVEWRRAPTTLAKGKLVRAVVAVTNRGSAPATNVELTVGGEGVEARAGVGPRDRRGDPVGAKLLFPALASLPPGETAEFTVDLAGATAGPGRIDASVTAGHQSLPLREERSVRVAND